MNTSLTWILLHADHHHIATAAPFVIGLIASFMHVVSGPDHLAAVTPLAIENRLKAWIVGLGWGLGHIAGMMLIGLLFLLFRNLIPVESISNYSELLVGLLLIAIGLWAAYRIFGHSKHHPHEHPHSHLTESGELITHIHQHDHPAMNVHDHGHTLAVRQSFISALLIGTLHGLAGVSHLIGMLPTLAFPTMTDSVMYLTGFGIGTIFAMVTFSIILGFISFKSAENSKPIIFRSVQFAGAAASLIIGIYWVVAYF